MSLRSRALPAGFIAPCLPTPAPQPPSGERWLHEIKHDGFRVIARKNGKRVKLYSRRGPDGIACFEMIRRWDTDETVFMWGFELLELNEDDLRRDPLVVQKGTLARVVSRAAPGLRFNEHLDEEDGSLFRPLAVLDQDQETIWPLCSTGSAVACCRGMYRSPWRRRSASSDAGGCFGSSRQALQTDQGSQFTGSAFTGVLATNGIAVSMDGKRVWRDKCSSSACGAASNTRR
jgi:transposase InsO family protein